MSVVGYKARNHPQQVGRRGAQPEVDDRATPPEVFGPLHERFGFTVDAAASPANAKCERFWTEADNGLAQPWTGERVWVNPPYSFPNIPAWVAKAWQEWKGAGPALIVMLVPANRTEQRWWQRNVEPHRDDGGPFSVEFLPGRPRFIRYEDGIIRPNERPPFGCCLLIWTRDVAATGSPVPEEPGE